MENQRSYIISHIVAASENNIIGKDDQMPWSLPDDFKYFKNKTWGMVVIMGRKTYEAMRKDLPGRKNIVITSNKDWKAENVTVCTNMQEAMGVALATDCRELFIIGGGQLYKSSFDITDRIYLTRVHAAVDGNIYYPMIDHNIWKLVSSIDHATDEKHLFSFTFEVWERIVPLS